MAPMRVNRGYERAARRGNMRFLDMGRYVAFRDIGLRGSRPDGSSRGRHAERDSLFAELLVTTGMRLEEAASLLVIELPWRELEGSINARRSIPFRIAAATAKGNKAREVRLPLRLLRKIRDYVQLERANIVASSKKHGAGEVDPLTIIRQQRDVLLIGTQYGEEYRVHLNQLAPFDRRRLIDSAATPLGLWLSADGRAMTCAAWEAVFRRASARCRSLGHDLDVSPHMLRHSFATHMLSMLIRAQIGSVLREPKGDSGTAIYRRMIGDPLQKLQRLLGHASITSTYGYLDSLEEARALVDRAVEQWAAEIEVST